MARTIERSEKMEDSIRLRCTAADKQMLNKAAASRGTNVSTFLRLMLIDQGLIKA